MSYDVFVKSSIFNFGSDSYDKLREELSKVNKPKYYWDDGGDLIIEEDYDMRHIEAVLKARDRVWEEYFAIELNEKQKQRVREAFDNIEVTLMSTPFEEHPDVIKRILKERLGL